MPLSSRRFALLLAVVCCVTLPAPLLAQREFEMTVRLGSSQELTVAAAYRDPADIDRALKGTRVIPMWLKVTNTSAMPVTIAYRDVTLDVGDSSGGVNPFPRIEAAAARALLQEDGGLNRGWRRFLHTGDRFAAIDPFGRELEGGALGPGKSKEGYVFFLRPDGASVNSFVALGVGPRSRAVLPTSIYTVMSPETESSSLWPATLTTWVDRFAERRDALARSIREIVHGPPPYRKSYALLMGVSKYQNLSPLPLVKNDLDRLSTVLVKLGFTVIRVEDEKLTLANVKSPQTFFEKVAGITEDDRLLVFFAGHGYHRDEGGRVRGYLALTNGRNGEGNGPNAIAMDDFVAWTQRIPAKHLLVLLESCFSGLAVRARNIDVQVMGASEPDPVVLYRLSNARGRYLVMAGDDTQRVPMSTEWNGGLFAQGIVEGLKGKADRDGDGFVTARELYPWLRTYVESESMRVLGKAVTPLFKDLYPMVSTGEFVFTTPR